MEFYVPCRNLVIGTSLLAIRTRATFLTYTGVGLFAFLVGAWVAAAAMTGRVSQSPLGDSLGQLVDVIERLVSRRFP